MLGCRCVRGVELVALALQLVPFLRECGAALVRPLRGSGELARFLLLLGRELVELALLRLVPVALLEQRLAQRREFLCQAREGLRFLLEPRGSLVAQPLRLLELAAALLKLALARLDRGGARRERGFRLPVRASSRVQLVVSPLQLGPLL